MLSFKDIFRRFPAQVWYIAVIPLFFLMFLLVYTPFECRDFLQAGRDLFAFNATMLAAVLLVFMACSRVCFHFIWRKREVSVVGYAGWCLGEMVAVAFFMALYMYLMLGRSMPYFSVLGKCLELSVLVSIYPYLVLTFLLLTKTFVLKHYDTESTENTENGALIRFTDTAQRLKLAVAASSVVYIEAEENYVRVHYMENGSLKDYVLRNSMKSVGELTERFGLVRCHRSYIVNPSHVSMLRKDKEGVIVADFDVPATPVSVSKKYYDHLTSLL